MNAFCHIIVARGDNLRLLAKMGISLRALKIPQRFHRGEIQASECQRRYKPSSNRKALGERFRGQLLEGHFALAQAQE
jgi:hypothetical protein